MTKEGGGSRRKRDSRVEIGGGWLGLYLLISLVMYRERGRGLQN